MSRKVKLKLAMPHAIKKVRGMPFSTDELRQLIRANLQDDVREFTVEYEDSDGDRIAIADDDDLHLAYEWAQESANGNLKLLISKADVSQDQDT